VFEEVAAHRLVPQGESADRMTLTRDLLRSVPVE
jgi:hypothetical protein